LTKDGGLVTINLVHHLKINITLTNFIIDN